MRLISHRFGIPSMIRDSNVKGVFMKKFLLIFVVVFTIILLVLFNQDQIKPEAQIEGEQGVAVSELKRKHEVSVAKDTTNMPSNESLVGSSDTKAQEFHSKKLTAVANSEQQMDEIGGYIDENAIAPEDEVPQNNDITSIGVYEPDAIAPEAGTPSITQGTPMVEGDDSNQEPPETSPID